MNIRLDVNERHDIVIDMFRKTSRWMTVYAVSNKLKLSASYVGVLLTRMLQNGILIRRKFGSTCSFEYKIDPNYKPKQPLLEAFQPPETVVVQPKRATGDQLEELNKVAELLGKIRGEVMSSKTDSVALEAMSKKIDESLTMVKTVVKDMERLSDYVASMKTSYTSIERRLAHLERELGI